MQIITADKPMIGTLYELAWAWFLKKPTVAIVADNWYCNHPFPRETFSATVQSMEEGCELINYFFEE
jgi:hypothetical protein